MGARETGANHGAITGNEEQMGTNEEQMGTIETLRKFETGRGQRKPLIDKGNPTLGANRMRRIKRRGGRADV